MGFPRFFVPTTQCVSRSNRAALARVMGEEGTRSPSVGAGLPPRPAARANSLRPCGYHHRPVCVRLRSSRWRWRRWRVLPHTCEPRRADVTRNHKSIPGEAATGAKIILELSGRSVDAMSNAPNAPKTHADDVISSATCLYLVPLFSFVLFFAGSNYEPKTRR
ncbi:hypothetical protein GW17_00051241 [Ensete ventricosum]|nr:hypothetical protein GW17_00051241 [Ensete ventricosum]